MEQLFWTSFWIIFYCYFGYPVIVFILGLLKKGSYKKDSNYFPTVSLLIVNYNEEKLIEKKIKNCLEIDYPKDKLEIVFASEANDGTNKIISKYQDQGIKLISFSDRRGKQNTIYRVLPQCQGEIIILSDANAIYNKDAVRKLVRWFADSRIGAVSGELKYINPTDCSIGEGEGLYWKYEIMIKKLESKIGYLLGANGSIYAIRRELYRPLSEYRGDDFEIPVMILIQGKNAILDSEAYSVEEVYESTKKEISRKNVIISWHFRSALILLKESLKNFRLGVFLEILSHKMIRWLIGGFMALLFYANYMTRDLSVWYKLFFIAQSVFYILFVIGFILDKNNIRIPRIINPIYYFVLINIVSIGAVIKGLFNKQKPTWAQQR